MTNQLKRDIIAGHTASAGHTAAIETYTKCISDLMPLQQIELVDTLISQYLGIITILSKELKEIKNGITKQG
jgi:hypothetical protein